MNTRFVLITFFILTIWGCKKDSEPPTAPLTETNLITNSSFESNGAPSYQGWEFWSNVQSPPSFSDNVPPNGGKWSTVLSIGDRVVAYLKTKVPAQVGTHRYKLSVWARSIGNSGSIRLLLNTTARKTLSIQDSLWRYYELSDTIETVQGDTLCVLLHAGSTYRTAQSHFDLCRLEILK